MLQCGKGADHHIFLRRKLPANIAASLRFVPPQAVCYRLRPNSSRRDQLALGCPCRDAAPRPLGAVASVKVLAYAAPGYSLKIVAASPVPPGCPVRPSE
jgi:hypothetical protein